MKKILMCPPEYFGVDYEINPWMKNQVGKVDIKKASVQWNNLYEALSKVAKVELIDPVSGLPDMVFTANAGLIEGKKAFLTRFSQNERSEEEIYFREWFLKNKYYVIEQNYTYFEGEGDCLRDHQWPQLFLGNGFRSQQEYRDVLYSFELNTWILDLIDPRFYHLDTCFCPLPGGEVLFFEKAFSDKSRELINGFFDVFIGVTEKEALSFCCNSVIIGKNIFMPKCDSVAYKLESIGYNVQQFDMSEFQKSGGACKCLVLHLN